MRRVVSPEAFLYALAVARPEVLTHGAYVLEDREGVVYSLLASSRSTVRRPLGLTHRGPARNATAYSGQREFHFRRPMFDKRVALFYGFEVRRSSFVFIKFESHGFAHPAHWADAFAVYVLGRTQDESYSESGQWSPSGYGYDIVARSGSELYVPWVHVNELLQGARGVQ
jgi:hypothetical protein